MELADFSPAASLVPSSVVMSPVISSLSSLSTSTSTRQPSPTASSQIPSVLTTHLPQYTGPFRLTMQRRREAQHRLLKLNMSHTPPPLLLLLLTPPLLLMCPLPAPTYLLTLLLTHPILMRPALLTPPYPLTTTPPLDCPISTSLPSLLARTFVTTAAIRLPATVNLPDADLQEDAPSDQPTIAALSTLGIKVRDFFYERTLPSIAPFRVTSGPVWNQIRPGGTNKPRPLKRTRPDGVDLGYGFVMGVPRTRQEKRQRIPTVPVLSRLGPLEAGVLLNLDDEAALRAAVRDIFGEPYSQEYSQDPSAPLVETPLVIPSGPLPWVNDDLSTHSPPLVPTEPASVQISMANVRAHGFHGLSQRSFSPPLPLRPAREPTPEPRYHLRPRKAPASPACAGRRLAPRRNSCQRREVESSLARNKGRQIVKSSSRKRDD
ncbi:hypothetical protein B0H13DRAFT_2310232 [Mycena leptocephala]|nr:hypothetical protein B0H13DRAFT_2310232 [Mycena leptocephala]